MRSSWLVRAMTPRSALKVLNLDASTSPAPSAIKRAFIQQTLQCHPDVHPDDPTATEKFHALSEALQVALSAVSSVEHHQNDSGATENPATTPQGYLDSLRHVFASHRRCREMGAGFSHGNAGCSSTVNDCFSSPTLTDITQICGDEFRAMRQVRTFSQELPTLLCGSRSAALFDTVVFFHSRYIQSMTSGVVRFSKNLPAIVSRVVRARKKHVSNRHSRATMGMGTGSRPLEQRIEDMPLKPLVLIGALIFALPSRNEDMYQREPVSSTHHGIQSPKEILVASELKCVIYPSDSIGTIATKISAWEAASYERLKVEQAITDAVKVVSDVLAVGSPEGKGFVLRPHLELDKQQANRLLSTVQKLACELCLFSDDCSAPDGSNLQDDQSEGETDHPPTVGGLISQCRRLLALASPLLEGPITLKTNDVDATSEIGESRGVPTITEDDLHLPVSLFSVSRHSSCCVAEVIRMAVYCELSDNVVTFLLRLRNACRKVVQEGKNSAEVLPDLLRLRSVVTKEEFIEQSPPSKEESSTLNCLSNEPQPLLFRHRGPVTLFPRIYNMSCRREKSFWDYVYTHREHLARCAPAMHPLNVFFECAPHDAEAVHLSPNHMAGWMGEATDGCDNVCITSSELQSAGAFLAWMDEIIEESTLSRCAFSELRNEGIGYVVRDSPLRLSQFLSFVRMYTAAKAVRSIMEHRNNSDTASRILSPHDVGLSIVVGYTCDVAEGGKLYIPWNVDPVTLLALLDDCSTNLKLSG